MELGALTTAYQLLSQASEGFSALNTIISFIESDLREVDGLISFEKDKNDEAEIALHSEKASETSIAENSFQASALRSISAVALVDF